MKFEIGGAYSPNHGRWYEYRANEYSIDYCGSRSASFGGALCNDITLEFDKSGCVMFASGYCPHTAWIKQQLHSPDFVYRRVCAVDCKELQRGVYHQIDINSRWQVYADSAKHSLCIGDPLSSGIGVCPTPGLVLMISGGSLAALWFLDLKGMR